MRVVVNQIAGLGQKTGIGHYTAELLRCMREQAAGDEIDAGAAVRSSASIAWVTLVCIWAFVRRARPILPATDRR